jgi:AAA family ATP:ADP antiporter
LFLLMTAYYVIKPVRESLILGAAGPEVKSYAGALGPLVFLLLVPLYGKMATRLSRIRLINGVSAFFASHLVIFSVLGQFRVSIGVVFFLWVGFFNLILVAQFWAFTNDIYTAEQGRRLFAIVGIGSSTGAISGAHVAGRLFMSIGPYAMMLLAAGLLVVCMALATWVHHRESRFGFPRECHAPLKPDGGFQLVFTDRYLLLIALLILLSNVVNTTGEFILGKSVAEHAKAAAAMSGGQAGIQHEYIGKFYADFYLRVNLIGAGLQIFAVSRVMRRTGIGPALLFLPLIALGGYSLVSIVPVLGLIRAVKIAENGTDYSLQNTARHALFLRTSREAKYKAKTAIDSFFWRGGDALSAVVVFVGTTFAFDLRGFARTNAVVALAWLCIAAGIVWLRLHAGESEFEETRSQLNDSVKKAV